MRIFDTVWVTVLSYMFNKDEGNMSRGIGWLFFGKTVLMILAAYLMFQVLREEHSTSLIL